MKKLIFLILFLAAVGVGLMVTCPDQAAHREAIKGVISEVVNTEMNKKSPLGSLEIISIGTVFTMDLVEVYLKSNLMVKDHTFFSLGYVTYKDDFKIVSFGILNHVFTIDDETARQLIKEKMSVPFK
jgi:hypothetical protein